MATTTFSGPIKAGTIANTTGTTVGTDMANVGYVVMAQSAAITQSTTAAASGIIIPAHSQILECTVYVTTAYDNSATLSIGTTSSSNELAMSNFILSESVLWKFIILSLSILVGNPPE